MRVSLIVAAGGSGRRFQKAAKGRLARAAKTKLFLELGGKLVLIRTLEAFRGLSEISETIVVAPRRALAETKRFLKQAGQTNVRLVAGGATRAESVRNGLRACRVRGGVVLVHDGARPLVRAEAVRRLLKAGASWDGAILASPVTATVKAVRLNTFEIQGTLDRRCLFTAETPQLARRQTLERAYRTVPDALDFTDEASLVEAAGGRVRVVTHDGWNPKITTPQDLALAESYLGARAVPRTGFGRDTHRLVKGRPFWLGGLKIPHDLGPLGHSDGDALLHAVVDAILGCMGKGDIGDWFSDKSQKFKGMASSKFVEAVMQEARKSGWKLIHCDTVVTLERPKLGPWKKKMAGKIAGLLGLKPEEVSVKAKTAEGLGAEGKGLAVTAEALVTMVKC